MKYQKEKELKFFSLCQRINSFDIKFDMPVTYCWCLSTIRNSRLFTPFQHSYLDLSIRMQNYSQTCQHWKEQHVAYFQWIKYVSYFQLCNLFYYILCCILLTLFCFKYDYASHAKLKFQALWLRKVEVATTH